MDSDFRKCSANIGKIVFWDLNSRIGSRLPGEEGVIGEHTFGRAARHKVEVPNRDLLMEFCQSSSLLIANTHFQTPDDEKVTFLEAGSSYLGPITDTGYNMLDLLLCDKVTLHRLAKVSSDRSAALGTDHYLVNAAFRFEASRPSMARCTTHNIASLRDKEVRATFASIFCSAVDSHPEHEDISNIWEAGKTAMADAAQQLPPKEKTANKPWISEHTINLIELRRAARASDRSEEEKVFTCRSRSVQNTTEPAGWTQYWKMVTGSKYDCCVNQES
jgi:hypothetical protein